MSERSFYTWLNTDVLVGVFVALSSVIAPSYALCLDKLRELPGQFEEALGVLSMYLLPGETKKSVLVT